MFKIRMTYDDREVQRILNRLLKQTGDLTPVMKTIGGIIQTSVTKNFEVGGRYSRAGSIEGGSKKWQPLAVATLFSGKKDKIVGKRGRFRVGFQRRLARRRILIRQGVSGGLMGSISVDARRSRVKVGPDLKSYAAIHQFGGDAGRGKKVKIPARPYLVIQREDQKQILLAIERHLDKGRE